jgi:polygalacturonase
VNRREMLAASVAAAGVGALAAAGVVRGETPAAGTGRGERVFDVRDFGAKGDGITIDTEAMQGAIDACEKEGGVVLVPAGVFVIGTVELKSNVTLRLSAKGKLLGSPNIKDYHAGRGVPPGNGNIVMLSAAEAENVTIEGPGTIDGNGAKFYNGRGDNTGPGQKSSEGYFQRPHLIVMYKCRNVVARDCFLTASAYHCFRILQCDRVKLDGVKIHNRVNKNNDGFHINSSTYVHVVNCDVQCQDDACALFGSNKFVTITNSSFSTRWSCFRFGGGNPENITVSNCLIYETYGCPIKMRFGRSSVAQNILFSNLVMRDVTGPISIGLQSSRSPSTQQAASRPALATTSTSQPARGVVRNISFNHIRATVVAEGRTHADLPFESVFRDGERRTCITINGAGPDDVLEDISLTDVHVTYEGGGTMEEAQREVPAIAGEYFEIGTPPAWGVYARNVRGLTMSNVRLEVTKADARPAVVLDGVRDATLSAVAAAGTANGATPVFRIRQGKDILLSATRVLTRAAVLLQAEGEQTEAITVDGGDLSKTERMLVLGGGASDKAVWMK